MSDETYNERQYRIWLHTPSEKHSKCNKCKAEIIWMKTERGKNIPVNPRKVSFRQLFKQSMKLLNRLGAIQRKAEFEGFGWEIHFDTCTGEPVHKEKTETRSTHEA